MKRMNINLNSEHFITNTGEKSLSSIIQNILPTKTSSLDFLVGYFYFSGIEEIYKNIENQKMRILVGLEMEKELLNKTSEFDFNLKKYKSSRQEVRKVFNESIVNLFNESGYFEGKREGEAFKVYYEKIKNGTLELRKTKDPCHAKMYIFSYKEELKEDGETPGTIITGSSNLTYNGLRGQSEINVRFQNKAEFKDAQNIFNSLWENAIVIADKDHIEDFENGVIKHIWFEKTPAPYLLYLRVLYEFFKIDTSKRVRTPHEITKGNFLNLKYQEDAIRLAISTINKHNGVIISDVVGLGKSIIGATVANNLDLRTIIIAPPHLTSQWEDYREEFKITAKIFSRGVINKALEHYNSKNNDSEQWLIIIDEAHNYRNEYTLDYGILHELCQGNKVMLLTATPFNNQPADIYSMVKLFQIPTKSTLQTVNNLGQHFREMITLYKELKKDQKEKKKNTEEVNKSIESIGKQIRNIISPLVIRRSRIDLKTIPEYEKDLKIQNIEFANVLDPELLDYSLGDLRNLYLHTLESISPKVLSKIDYDIDEEHSNEIENSKYPTFKASRYQPINYIKKEFEEEIKKNIEEAGFDYNLFKGTQRNLATFMRTMLVHRFESSQTAFRTSLQNMVANYKNIKLWIEKRQAVPIFKKGMLPDIQNLYDSTSDIISELVDSEIEKEIAKFQVRGLFEIKTEYLKNDFFEDLETDLELLQSLQSEWDLVPASKDPKLNEFISILKKQLHDNPDRKIVVFSQFADTVDYLGERLKSAGLPVFSYTASKATTRNKEIIRANFDAGYDTNKQHNTYKILVATDAISEGYNLHRAGTIFNYDIPYNPTRVIQRIGRINRVNKKMFDNLFIFNYFPTDIGESETRTHEISTLKMAMIHAIMGEDTKILTSNEQLHSFFAEKYKQLITNEEQKSWDADYRAALNQYISTPEMKLALKLPLRSKISRRTTLPDEGVIVFAKKGNDYVFKYSKDMNNPTDISPEFALKLLHANYDEKGYTVSEKFDSIYNAIKQTFFNNNTEGESEKNKRDALAKVDLIIKNKSCDSEYLYDLRTAIEYDAISGYALRLINRLKISEYYTLPDKISKNYISKLLAVYDSVSHGSETLIFAEEILSSEVLN
jgi:Superfamily II DNA and RNA helicases